MSSKGQQRDVGGRNVTCSLPTGAGAKKPHHWWSDIFHTTPNDDQHLSPRSSNAGSTQSSTPEPKETAAEEWRRERRLRTFLGGW